MHFLNAAKVGTFILAAAAIGCQPEAQTTVEPTSPPQTMPTMVEVEGLKTRVRTNGLAERKPGEPVVVFQNGGGSTLESWSGVFEDVSKFAPTVAYDRPGIGGSEASEGPPTPKRAVAHLRALLAKLEVAPPYLLVGHSWGGPLQHFFAAEKPEDIVGIVYVDPTDLTTPVFPLPQLTAMGFSLEKQKEIVAKMDAEMSAMMEHAHPELKAELQVIDELFKKEPVDRGLPPVPEVPTTVILAARQGPMPPGATKLFDERAFFEATVAEKMRSTRASLAKVPVATIVVAAHAEHNVMGDDPDLVVDAVRRTLFPPIVPQLLAIHKRGGTKAMAAEYQALKIRQPERIKERDLNALGYRFLGEGDADSAIACLELNVAEYPNSANTYDSLGEAYMAKGDREKAIANYKKSLELNPANQNATQMLKRLESQ